MPQPHPSLGGQAVIEGVLIRAPGSFAVAVRRPSGEIVVRQEQLLGWPPRAGWLRLPITRGVYSLVQALGIGVRGLVFAALQTGCGGALAAARVDSPRGLPPRGLDVWTQLRRLPMYHRAAQQVLAAYRAGESLDVRHVRRHSNALRPPDDAMLEVALVALKAALLGGGGAAVTCIEPKAAVYQSFADVCARQG